jgi:uncharacterized SAM-binding protein YcdF (DUF218 family)
MPDAPPRDASPVRRPVRHRRARGCLAWLGGALALVVALWLLRVPVLRGIGGWLVVGDEPAKADLIYVLGGEPDVRAFAAAALYRQGWAPRVVFPETQAARTQALGLVPPEAAVTRAVLRHEVVPDSAIVLIPRPSGSKSTADDARMLRAWLERHPARRVIVVTTDYHTRRARWHLRRALRGSGTELVMHGAPHPAFGPRDWWKSEGGLVTYVNEYLKLAHNRFAAR